MSYTRSLALCLAALAACASSDEKPGVQGAEPLSRPNILFVFTDDHASHAISAYGSKINRTPNIDRLAREGMLFANTFCGNSICAPSRATVLTGKHSFANGHLDNGTIFDGSQLTFPKLLQGAGYQTAMIGKWHLKSDPTGFDHWQVLVGQGPYYNPPIKSADGQRKIEGYTTEILTDLALDWLQQDRDPERPFLLMYQHKAPHRNWQPGPRELGMFDETVFPEPATLFDDYAGRTSATLAQEMTLRDHMSLGSDLKLKPPGNLTPEQKVAWDAVYEPKRLAFEAAGLEGDELVRWKYQRYMQDYLACIDAVDHQLGRVLDYLDESGLADNTVVVYSSDQGFYLGDHGWYDKRWMYEESLRMPFIVRWPGVTAPASRCEALTQNIDFGPTFLDAAGLEVPEQMHGVSMLPLLQGQEPADWRDSLYYHYYEFPAVHMVNRHYGVRTERYKLIRYYQLDEWELFDLEQDPDELRSVADDPAYAQVRAELERELRRLQEHYGETDAEHTVERIYQGRAQARAAAVEPRHVLSVTDPTEPIAAAPDPSSKAFTLCAVIEAGAGDGVVVAQGGQAYGYALHLRDGRPTFTVRNRNQLFEVAAEALDTTRPTHLAAVLDASGDLSLYVDGLQVDSKPGQVIERKPSDGLVLGSDPGSPVAGYEAPNPFQGRLRQLQLSWGAADARAVWALFEEAQAQK